MTPDHHIEVSPRVGSHGAAFTFGTFCSGIEAASEAFLPLGAECLYVAEVEPYPCGVLADRHGAGKPMRMPKPEEAKTEKERRARMANIKAVDRFGRWGNRIPNLGDLTQIEPEEVPAVDLLVAGYPCQDFSIAGLRKSLAGARGNLTLYGVKLTHELVRLGRVGSVLLEQVPDILNTKDNAFGSLLAGLVGHDAPIHSPLKGGRWPNSGVADGPDGTAAWRVLDAQYAGLAQRRERVFLVGSFGNGPDPVEVLLECESGARNPPARRQEGQGIARPLAAGSSGSGGYRNDADTAENLIPSAFGGNNTAGPIDVATARTASHTASHTASGRQDFESETFVVGPVATALGARDGAKGVDSDATDTLIPVDHALRAKHNMAHRADVDTLVPVTYSIMPQNSGKDYKARVVDVAQPLMASGPVGGDQGGDQGGDYVVQPIAYSIQAGATRENPDSGPDGVGVQEGISYTLEARSEVQAVAFSLRGREGGAMPEVEDSGLSPSIRAADGGSTRPFIAFGETQITSAANRSNPQPGDPCHPLAATARPPSLADEMAVRRITVLEAEILQGFRPHYTLIEWPTANRKGQDLEETITYLVRHGFTPAEAERLAQTPDGPRYKAIGNSKAVPLVRAIGARYLAALQRYRASEAA